MRPKTSLTTAMTLALAALALVPFSAAQAAPAPAQLSADSEQQRRFTKVGLLMNAGLTQAAAERSTEQIQAEGRALASARQRAVMAERDAATARKEADAERRKSSRASAAAREAEARAERAEAEAARLRDEQVAREEAWLNELGRRDVEYAAAKDEFVRRVNDMVERRDPRIDDALARYLAGDIGALDDLAEYTEALVAANRAGREAAIADIQREGRRRDGNLLRSTAAIWLDAVDKGEKPARAALAKWLDAARTDPDEFSQWQTIYDLADEIGDAATQADAVNQLWTRARTLEERIDAAATCASQHIGKGRWCNGEWTRAQYADEKIRLWREKVAQKPDEPFARIGLATALWAEAMLIHDDKQRRASMLTEAVAMMDKLSQQYPDSSLIASRRLDIVSEGGGLSLAPGPELERTRGVFATGLQAARAQLARSPDSFAAISNLAKALRRMSVVADADRDVAQSIALIDEAIALAEGALAKDPESDSRGAVLWHSLTRAAMSARIHGVFSRERDLYARTLALSRRFADGDSRYMVELTVPRLANAETVLGNLAAARMLLDEEEGRLRARLASGDLAADDAEGELYGFAFERARLSWIEGDYGAGEGGFRALLRDVLAQPVSEDRILRDSTVVVQLYLILVEQGRIDEALAVVTDARTRLQQLDSDPQNRQYARFSLFLMDVLAASTPDSGVRWADLKPPSMDGLDTDRYTTEPDLVTSFLAERAKLDAGLPTNGTRQERLRASLRANYDVTLALSNKQPPSQTGAGSLLNGLKMLAHAGDPEASWQVVADQYLDLHKRGWVAEGPSMADFEFAMARAAVLRRRANADLLPVEAPK